MVGGVTGHAHRCKVGSRESLCDLAYRNAASRSLRRLNNSGRSDNAV